MEPIKWEDFFEITKERIAYTYNELNIPGLRLFGMIQPQKAILPLQEHYHENAFEFTFVTQGEMSFFTNGKYYVVPGGSIFISYPNEIHSTNQIPLTPKQAYWMQVDISDPNHFLFLSSQAARQTIEELYSIKKHMVTTDNQEIRYILKYIFSQCMTNGSRLEISSYLNIFFQKLIRFAQSDQNYRALDIDAAVSYINEHITEELTLNEIARISNLSLSQFKQKFNNFVGMSPRNYINAKKIEYSKQLLCDGISITDTAMQLCFNSSTYYSTVFKKYTMLTPSQYIARVRSGQISP